MSIESQSQSAPRVAIVTGGSEGLGRALAEVLVDRGWHVVIDGRRVELLAIAATTLGPNVTAVVGDISDPEHRHELVATARATGPISLLVNNAGTLGPSPLPAVTDLDDAALTAILRANVVAPAQLIGLTIDELRSNAGTVVNITSDAAVEAYEGWGGYGASKAALDHLGAVLAVEEPTVRVLRVDPGDLRTAMHQAAFPGEDISDRPLPSAVAPTIVDLVESDRPSGRYRAGDLVVASIADGAVR